MYKTPLNLHTIIKKQEKEAVVSPQAATESRFISHFGDLLYNDSQILQMQMVYLMSTPLPEEEVISAVREKLNSDQVFEGLGMLAALIIRYHETNTPIINLLHLVVQEPIRLLSYKAVTAAVFCWDWLSSTVPWMLRYLFLELLHSWRYLMTL